MILVTERVVGSMRNLQSGFASVPGAPPASRALRVSPLEVKVGMATVAETLQFLHNDAGLAHCGLHPGVMMLAADGGWKLAGFAHAISADYAAAAAAAQSLPSYSDPFPPPWEEMAKVKQPLGREAVPAVRCRPLTFPAPFLPPAAPAALPGP
jgi:hypothetical protein